MFANLLHASRCSIQFKMFLSLTVIVALSLAAILASQVYLVQDYFIRQAEANLRASNYLLSRVLADPLFEHDLALLQTRLQDVQSRMPLCNLQLKDDVGTVVYKVGEVMSRVDTDFDPGSRDGCYNTIVPVMHGERLLGTVRMGVRTDEIAKARHSLILGSVYFSLFWFAVFMLPFFIQIRRLVQPLGELSRAAEQFAHGNLDYPPPVLTGGDDEIAQLTASFNGMAQALVHNRDLQAASLAALNNEKSTLDALLATIPVGVIFADRDKIRYCNTALGKMFQIDPKTPLAGMKNEALLLLVGLLVAEVENFLKIVNTILETRTLTEPAYIALKDGRILRMISNTVKAPDGEHYLGRFWLFEDATEEMKQLQIAEKRGEQDALTSLHNRHRYEQDLQRLFAQAERDGIHFALLLFDLDDFKPINDQFGHAAGDAVLRQVSLALSAQLRRNEVLYRIGGDEFALLLANASDEEVAILAERIVNSVRALSFEFDGKMAKVGCSLGVARYPRDANSIQSLKLLADQAMYLSKNTGKGRFNFVSKRLGQAIGQPEQPKPVASVKEMTLGIAVLDAQHLAIANFMHGIHDSLMAGDKSLKLQSRVQLLLELCRIHFQTEEELMAVHHIPILGDHSEEHSRQLESLKGLFGNLNPSSEELEAMPQRIDEWLHAHIGVHDMELAAQLKSKGVS